jgi:hypothetical protein
MTRCLVIGFTKWVWIHRQACFSAPLESPADPDLQRRRRSSWTWIDLGKPSLSRRRLAHAVYRAEFTNADSAGRKKMIDRCRRAVERWQAQSRLNRS